ncbi:helical backbone metal receptor [Nocardiopsis composta]|uniref:ABC-type Fe3+-hydroxamate transport system substrate-binding protein n=1 Tax=Nocardiopsis composta TaxID=157465 RepID=A0A7W8VBP0_9ACTN|nr:helical backbone metal receptor [Nocardiopsis composta]MBB5430074.1 ABC-type Fe3+-hydroxamate transport system substrate-binding protein [Nocardiopsis composta]
MDRSGARVLHDDLGRAVPLPRRVRRVVSLVPSLTEAIAETGPELLAGCTEWCTHPPGLAAERLRGTKNPHLRRIAELAPDLVVANKEENRERHVAELERSGVPVWVTDVGTVPGALRSLRRLLVEVCSLAEPGWLAEAEAVWAGPVPEPRLRVAVPIWRDPWMVVGGGTFAGDVLARLGAANVFAGDARYPATDPEGIAARSPDAVVLPDEPYRFTSADGPEAFPSLPSVLVSGRDLTWYGPSLVAARERLEEALGGPPR